MIFVTVYADVRHLKSMEGMERGQLGKEHDLSHGFGIFFFIAA
jgi:hypothetical protein